MKETDPAPAQGRVRTRREVRRVAAIFLPPFERPGVKVRVPRLPFLGFRPAAAWAYPPWNPAGSRRTPPFRSPFRSPLS
jgi:hypothetical protein